MTQALLNQFSGIQPRVPDAMLPPHGATVAHNCDFAYGELRNTKGGFLLTNLAQAAQSIYTSDGITFFSWNRDVDAVRSPIAQDQFQRLYFTDGAQFRVARRDLTQLNGGEPSTSFAVGVPAPTVAPSMTVPSLPNLTNANIVSTFHYEYSGVKYQEQQITMSATTPNQVWTFTPPARSATGTSTSATGFPATAVGITYNALDNNGYLTSNIVYTQLPANSSIIVTGPSTVQVVGQARPLQNVTYVKDQNGAEHETESLFSLAQYAVLTTQSTSGPALTPAQAFPVVRLTGTDKTTGAQLFDVYTKNSSFAASSSSWQATLTQNPDGTTYTVSLGGIYSVADKITRAYVYTYVNAYGEEGPPSPPALVDTYALLEVDVTTTLDAQSLDYSPVNEIRVYRTPASGTANYCYVGSVTGLSQGGPTFVFTDTVDEAGLAETLASTFWYAPPQNLQGLCSLANGILCAFKDNELWFSEAYKPWAWPPSYVLTFQHSVVNVHPYSGGAMMTTTFQPFIISGVTPDAMTPSGIDAPFGGVSKWSIADVGGTIAFATNEGIVIMMGAVARLDQSAQFFTREVWRQRYSAGLPHMRFAVWDGRLIVYSANIDFTPFMIRLDEAAGTMTELPNLLASCQFISPLTDQFYYGAGTAIYEFNGGDDQIATWQSREQVFPATNNFGACEAVCTGNWTIEFFSEDQQGNFVQRFSQAVTGTTRFRPPAGYKSKRYKIMLWGTGSFRELRLADTMRSLSLIGNN